METIEIATGTKLPPKKHGGWLLPSFLKNEVC
jgi:hypothetical protein